ncbi:MAG: hypothetical protein ACM3SS_19080 [Rhodospirillaceae bacterium]
MTPHAEVTRLVAAINGALDSLTVGDGKKAVPMLYDVIEVFSDSRLSSNQEVWQLFDPYLSVVTVCASTVSHEDPAATQLFAEAVRLKLDRIRP